MPLRLSESLVIRALKFFLLLVFFIGGISLFVNYYLASNDIKERTLNQVEQLINTIEPSAQISAYLNDKSIAREIGRGLIKNPIISQVELINSDGQALISISRGKNRSSKDTVVERSLNSPFDSSVKVGILSVVLDSRELNEQKIGYLISVLTPTILQTIAVALAIVWSGLAVLMPKVRVFLSDMEKLDVQNGELLDTSNYQQSAEILHISEYINGLIQKMYSLLSSERSLRRESDIQHRKMEAIFENARTGIFLADKTGHLLSYNQACQVISLREGRPLTDNSTVMDILTPDIDSTAEQILKSLASMQKLHLEIFLPAKNGHRESWLQLTLTPVDDYTIQGVINDISAVKSESLAAQSLARTDPLTQLGNRLGFDSEFKRRLSNTAAGEQSLTLMSIDLDRFKAVNDTFGHDAGDQVLMYVAHQLQQITRSSDYICRMGGDEFNILLDDISQDMAGKLASRIVKTLHESIVLEPGIEAQIGASVGVVFVPEGYSVSSDDLLRRADKTMYQVKHGGRNNYSVVNYSEARAS